MTGPVAIFFIHTLLPCLFLTSLPTLRALFVGYVGLSLFTIHFVITPLSSTIRIGSQATAHLPCFSLPAVSSTHHGHSSDAGHSFPVCGQFISTPFKSEGPAQP